MKKRYSDENVRVIGPKSEDLGIMAKSEALRLAEGMRLELVEVSPRAKPPVCRIMDYAKFKFETAKKARDARREALDQKVKEVGLRPGTEERDLELKVLSVRRFLATGHLVKVAVRFRGREALHPETAQRVLERFAAALADGAEMAEPPILDGNRMSMLLAPKGRDIPSS